MDQQQQEDNQSLQQICPGEQEDPYQEPGTTAGGTGKSQSLRKVIWQGILWYERTCQKPPSNIPGQITTSIIDGATEVSRGHWPDKLLVQLIPANSIRDLFETCYYNARYVEFHPISCEALDTLTYAMGTLDYVGCIFFTGVVKEIARKIKVMVLQYMPDERAYIGFIPNDQAGFEHRIRKVIKLKRKQGQPSESHGIVGSLLSKMGINKCLMAERDISEQGHLIGVQKQTQPHGTVYGATYVSETATGEVANYYELREVIWQGILEWHEGTVDSREFQAVPCQISTMVVDGEVEVIADHWPKTLFVEFIPVSSVENFLDVYFRHSCFVDLHPIQCVAWRALRKSISTGQHVGCVFFTETVDSEACENKIMILQYKLRTLYGFIPNDQDGFADRIRKVIQQLKSEQCEEEQLAGPSGSDDDVEPQEEAPQGIVEAPCSKLAIENQRKVNHQIQPEVTTGSATNVAGTAEKPRISQEREIIWNGVLEWRAWTNSELLTRHVPCNISASDVDGQVKGRHWPHKMVVNFIEVNSIRNFYKPYFHNARYIRLHPQQCEAQEALTHLLSTGYVGCILFKRRKFNSRANKIKIMMIVFIPEKGTYVGYIPNDQTGFLDRIRRACQLEQCRHETSDAAEDVAPHVNASRGKRSNPIRAESSAHTE